MGDCGQAACCYRAQERAGSCGSTDAWEDETWTCAGEEVVQVREAWSEMLEQHVKHGR